jgi:parallel beta-helix repeat protein
MKRKIVIGIAAVAIMAIAIIGVGSDFSDLLSLKGEIQDENLYVFFSLMNIAGADDLTGVRHYYVRLDPIADVNAGEPLVVTGTSNRQQGYAIVVTCKGPVELEPAVVKIENDAFTATFDTTDALTGEYIVKADDGDGHTDEVEVFITGKGAQAAEKAAEEAVEGIVEITATPEPTPTPTLTPIPTPTPKPTPYYVNPGESIQAAVDAADLGDTIVVRDGTYTENINVYKRLTIKSENGSENCIVLAENPKDHVFKVTTNYVNITGFTIKDASFSCGILLTGVNLTGVNNCTISTNIVSGNSQGIYLTNSIQNIIANNSVKNNSASGISLMGSNDNEICNNIANSNLFNGIYLNNSNDNRITDNNASNTVNWDGISLSSSNNNEVRNNVANFNNYNGIVLWISSNKNIVANNTAKHNGDFGIIANSNNNNRIYLNNFMGNGNNNAYSISSTNIWNSLSKITYTYKGSTYTKYLGNYWSDYEEKYPDAEEIDSTGIWDTPYSIDDEEDIYPLVMPIVNFGNVSWRPKFIED